MEILWLTENYIPSRGGMAQSCDRIIRALREKGTVIHILHFTNRRKPFHTETSINGTYTAVPVHNDIAHTLNLCMNFLTNPQRKFSFSKIVAFGGVLPMNGAPVFAKIFGSQLYTLLRGNDFDVSIFSPRRKYYLDQLFDASEAVCVNSSDKAARIKKLYPESRVVYTPNGIDTDDWQLLKTEQKFAVQWKSEHVAEGKKILGLFGNLKEKKGIVFFIQSLIKSGKKHDVHLLFTGDMDEKAIDLLSSHDIAYSLLPFMDRSELMKYYSTCHWICIPSFYEGMPNVMLEAGSLGIPVLASHTDGMKDMLCHGENGLVFHPSDAIACSEQIFMAVNMPEADIEKLGHNLKNKILAHFTTEMEADNYIRAFKGEPAHFNIDTSINKVPHTLQNRPHKLA